MRRLNKIKNKNIKNLKNKFFVFDVETTCLEPQPKNFVFGCLYGYNHFKTFYKVDDFIKEFSRPFYKNKYIFAHNAEFDLLTIFGNIFIKVDNSAIFNGKFISAQYKDTLFCDSMNIYPTSVAKLGNLLQLSKIDSNKIKSGNLRKNNVTEDDINYCKRDCEIVYKALLRIFELIGDVKITLPSLAMYDFRKNYIYEDVLFSELVDEFYASYYGGRTEAFYIGNCNAKAYDINSMYPKAMVDVILPDVKHLRKTENCDVSYLLFCLEHYEGMAKVTVIHKKTFFGYLPCRLKLNGTTKLVFPVGEFTTTVNFNELRFAINENVVEIKKVFFVIYGNPIKSIFSDYIYDNYAKRKSATNVLDSMIYKLKMNTIYGRFAMKMKMTTTYWEQFPYNLISELKAEGKYCDIKLFNPTRPDCFVITQNEKSKNSYFSIPTFSSYITSQARVTLLKTLIANECNNVLYCDTDSIFLERDFIGNVSDELGDFKVENKKIIQIRGLKNYTYIDKDGKTNNVIKGVSRSSIKKGTFEAGTESYSSERYYKTKESIRQNKQAGQSYIMVKKITNNYDKREVLPDGNTNALFSKNDILINATKFIRPKSDAAKRKRLKAFIYEPQNVKEYILLFFVNGGKVYTKDLIDNVTGKSKEIKYYKGLHDKNGMHMDVFCEMMPEYFYTDRIIDAFQDVLLSFNNKNKMLEYLEQLKKEQITIKPQILEYDFDYDTPF